ncbi:hypothetical protein J3E72DRAFT_438978 [Bipolaris maydis]|nr:hypothetical protein J3E72DRAFT_443249 [Bipolaris maydis]KAJ6198295.1 hypothetical protein J3E72DRAFT_438978 [Bipolaris maydis]KAJ6281873.1 hypothetical protein J3E71DRAFT_198165 [Bipolaris maydis]
MRFSYRFLLICLALLVCLQSTAAAPHAAVRRQDDNSSEDSTPSTTRDSASRQASITSTPEPTPSARQSSRIESNGASSAVPSSAKPSASATTQTEVPSTASSDEPVPSSPAINKESPLPIYPKLTPAMGITGVILLVSGLVYGIIGIKKKMVYVFGSAAYLSALAVTVLIIYLMNPPVSDAIQGAFFVAAFFTGIIFGVLSLVFVDMTEGFGCLLGGFCLSMWLLSLKDGGLISSSTGRAIFIGCMAAAGWSLSFSRYTRNYGLIASIAFSGATASVLGIDCLAGAGWKEFWLYLWALNDSTFPLDTNTYPVTKNMKAELAGVIIIAVAGIISQLRVWKMIQEHRAKDAAQQLERQQDLAREEEERGRKIEDEFQKERAQWEAAYGEKNLPDGSPRSSVTSPKKSTSLDAKEVDSSENLLPAARMNKASGGTVTVGVLNDDEIQPIDAEGCPVVESREVATRGVDGEKTLPGTPEETPQLQMVENEGRTSLTVSPPPAVVPLPFKVPTEEDAHSNDDNSSVSAMPETEADMTERPAVSKRVSDVSAMRQRISRDLAASQEAVFVTQDVNDDRASSVAATLDDDNDQLSIRELSPVQSPIGTEHNPFVDAGHATKASGDMPASEESTTRNETTKTDITKEHDNQTLAGARQSLTPSTDSKQSGAANAGARRDTAVFSSKTSSADQQSKGTQSDAPSLSSHTEPETRRVSVLREGALPETMSKVALSYRTNEWAKHLEGAEKPDYEDIFRPSSPGMMLPNGIEEKPAPISEELAAPLKGNQRNSRRVSNGSRMQRNSSSGFERNSLALSQESLVDPRIYTRSPPAAVLSRASSKSRPNVLAPLPTNTLMSKRETLLKNRASALVKRHSSGGHLLLGRGEDQVDGQGEEVEGGEEMTLAQRRQMLQRQSSTPQLPFEAPLTSPRRAPPSASQKWQNKDWAGKGAPPGFDSHQPQRTNSAQSNSRREQLYAGWRDSIRDAGPAQTSTTYIIEQQRAALLFERRQKELEKQQREMVQQQRASQMDSMMRSGHMLDAHREAMRKMQASANRHA